MSLPALNSGRLVELAIAIVLLGAGLWFYTRRVPMTDSNSSAGRRDSQGAVLLLAVAIILGTHALGGLDYHPSQAELDSASHGATSR
ncbi:hypothetical protein [Sphingomonas sp.]|uniref:hypothetical protein n=1 Tax=Sphingomonas sp. TaxID=28214 RepID=UPI0025F8E7CE|nr:hypothetical protein [Sphingomonas sp.]MBV9527998.1 hypothetical protein [Sphingomonas sp.]